MIPLMVAGRLSHTNTLRDNASPVAIVEQRAEIAEGVIRVERAAQGRTPATPMREVRKAWPRRSARSASYRPGRSPATA